MRAFEAEPLHKSKCQPMNFSIVPMTEVPPPGHTPGAAADRPMVLVVDDEPAVADTVSEILNRNGYLAIAAYDGEDALETALLIPPELVITDVGLPGMSGIEVASALRAQLPDCKVLLLAESDGARGEPAAAQGAALAHGLIDKPVQAAKLLRQVSASLSPR